MSTRPYWKAYKFTGGAPSYWADVQDVQITYGRRNVTDNFRATVATVHGRRPDLLPAINLGDQINLELYYKGDVVPPVSTAYSYRVSDFRIDYGVVSSMDTWTLQLEDSLGVAGRSTIDVSWVSGQSTSEAFDDVMDVLGLTYTPTTATHFCNAQTITDGNALDILQTIANTEQGIIYGEAGFMNFYLNGWAKNSSLRYWSDDGTGTLPVVYDTLEFRGLAENYADQVTVKVRQSTNATAGAGSFSYVYDTYSQNNSVASDNANFVLNLLSASEQVPFSVSAILENQPLDARFNAVLLGGVPASINLKFRGTTYETFVIGTTITSTPETTRCTQYLAARSTLSALILDNQTGLGTLDNNRLGF